MQDSASSTPREWRKLVKKLQRKKRRQKAAKERDKQLEMELQAEQNDLAFKERQKQQLELEEFQALQEQNKHDDEEADWLRRELIAQQQFKQEEKRRLADEAAKEAKRLQEEKELKEREATKRKQREEKERLAAEAAAEFDALMKKFEMYLENSDLATPQELQHYVETKPGQKLCELYERTNCCRFGDRCTSNHRRPMLSRILLIQHFFSHPLLKPIKESNYIVSDAHSESSERDLRNDYDAFFEDVVPELESFGTIKTFCALRNILPHLSGNVLVEYADKRSALRAFVALQGRYYAMRPLAVEFSNVSRWRSAVCGLAVDRKCDRGNNCRYFHLLKNPGSKYNCVLENTRPPFSKGKPLQIPTNFRAINFNTPQLGWNEVFRNDLNGQKRNWRWSESPEKVLVTSLEKNRSDQAEIRKSLCDNKRPRTENNFSPEQKKKNPDLEENNLSSKSKEHAKKKHKEKHKSKKSKDKNSKKSPEGSDKVKRLKRKHKSHKKHKKKSKSIDDN